MMMKIKDQQSKKTVELDEKAERINNLRQTLVNYLDITIRSMIAFLIIGILGSIIFIGWLKWKPVLFFPILFILSILSAPLFSRIRLGEIIFQKYEGWLKNTFKLK